jgi:hypothetical protein
MKKNNEPSAFEKAAAEHTGGGFVSDLWLFLKTNKKWWLIPIICVFLIIGLLLLLSSTGLAPFIYALF